MNIYFRQLGP